MAIGGELPDLPDAKGSPRVVQTRVPNLDIGPTKVTANFEDVRADFKVFQKSSEKLGKIVDIAASPIGIFSNLPSSDEHRSSTLAHAELSNLNCDDNDYLADPNLRRHLPRTQLWLLEYFAYLIHFLLVAVVTHGSGNEGRKRRLANLPFSLGVPRSVILVKEPGPMTSPMFTSVGGHSRQTDDVWYVRHTAFSSNIVIGYSNILSSQQACIGVSSPKSLHILLRIFTWTFTLAHYRLFAHQIKYNASLIWADYSISICFLESRVLNPTHDCGGTAGNGEWGMIPDASPPSRSAELNFLNVIDLRILDFYAPDSASNHSANR
ncbi:hypothetical protein B0H34DRAFT_811676 [Crassisporium funariophilum]|nr:hypothetical protein B0H34DRAFT_811676 [Crassisporium funariophilum]